MRQPSIDSRNSSNESHRQAYPPGEPLKPWPPRTVLVSYTLQVGYTASSVAIETGQAPLGHGLLVQNFVGGLLTAAAPSTKAGRKEPKAARATRAWEDIFTGREEIEASWKEGLDCCARPSRKVLGDGSDEGDWRSLYLRPTARASFLYARKRVMKDTNLEAQLRRGFLGREDKSLHHALGTAPADALARVIRIQHQHGTITCTPFRAPMASTFCRQQLAMVDALHLMASAKSWSYQS